ncbi:MAG: sugar kinase [Spirochaetales bacterium]|uniref:Sugar kinase n=1 Tax=Candidatus Thalassospirochaeta sargassi TaxID=3119039 RepID=A0AAJ1IG38_9SPIO|nr:sugar kinase [Spirochaetales bacterium]
MGDNIVVTFGEIMGRLAPEGFMRFRQGMPGHLQISFSGAEANVAVSNQVMGRHSRFVSALPDNAMGQACLDTVRKFGVDTSFIHSAPGRLGLYFVETGANQRPSSVIYDREHSVISETPADAYNWKGAFSGADWFHISGITPAISKTAAEASLSAVKEAKNAGLSVSCDLNFRKKLWKWEDGTAPRDLAEKTMRKILPYVDVVIGNEEDAWDVLQIKAGDTDVHSGKLEIARYPDVAKKIIAQFPNVTRVAITLRESLSATHNNWGAMLYDSSTDKAFFAPMSDDGYQPFEIKNIVDRVGGGDAFSAGLCYALTDDELSGNLQDALSYAVAASCLCHSIQNDFNYSSRDEVMSLMKGNSSGRVKR